MSPVGRSEVSIDWSCKSGGSTILKNWWDPRISGRPAEARVLQLKCTHSMLLSIADSWGAAVVGGRIFHFKKIENQKKLSE
jgi:hypothetical protein